MLYRRAELLHKSMLLDLPPAGLDRLLDQIEVEGESNLTALQPDRGVLLLSVHFWLFSSWLWLWLMRAAERKLLPSLDIAIDSGGSGFGLPRQTLDRWEAAGMYSPRTSRLLDVSLVGRATAARRMVCCLRTGQALLLFPDNCLLPAAKSEPGGLSLGTGVCGMPPSVAWLSRNSDCAIVAVHIEPRGDGHAIVIQEPVASDAAGKQAWRVLQRLLDSTANLNPMAYAPLCELSGCPDSAGLT